MVRPDYQLIGVHDCPSCAQEREDLLDQLEQRPDAMWKAGSFWSFRNEAKIYGSPSFDAAWAQVHGLDSISLPQMIAALRAAPVPHVPAETIITADEKPAISSEPTKAAPLKSAEDPNGSSLAVLSALAEPGQAANLLLENAL